MIEAGKSMKKTCYAGQFTCFNEGKEILQWSVRFCCFLTTIGAGTKHCLACEFFFRQNRANLPEDKFSDKGKSNGDPVYEL